MDTRRGANRARARGVYVHTGEDFNDLSSGIRRMTIDTRFHLDRSRTLLRILEAAVRPRPGTKLPTEALIFYFLSFL